MTRRESGEVDEGGGVPGRLSLQSRLPARLSVDAEPSSGRFGPFRVIVVPTGPGAPDGKRRGRRANGGVRRAECERRACEERSANGGVRTLIPKRVVLLIADS